MIRLQVSKEIPKFINLIESISTVNGKKASTIKDIIDDVFNVAVERGLSDEECSLLLHLFHKNHDFSMNDKLKILQNLVPEKKIPVATIREFMLWFTSIVKGDNISVATSSRILQWIIGLLEHDLVDSGEIYNFYDDLYVMLECPSLIPYVAKLLCKLTKPLDVTSQTVRSVWSYLDSRDPSNKYMLAVLNVFKGYKPHLMLEEVKKVNIPSVLNSVHQTMDSVMRVRAICTRATQLSTRFLGIREVQTPNFSYFKEELNKTSSLIPLPTYDFEGMDKFEACYPNSIEEACKYFSRVPIPENIMSLLHNDVGFFTITYQGIEVQMRFHSSLLQTLQNALIYQELNASDEDIEFLLRRVYCLQTFIQQGIPCVSVFLSGYLLDWDGATHRYSILKLLEWATFHTFRELACSVLRALHVHFVTNDTNMRQEIIRTLTNLLRNMFLDVSRVQQGIPFPFMKRGPKWTKEPETMLFPLIAWTENLITLGLSMEEDGSALLMEAIQFYKMLNHFEASSNLPMFTVVTEGVVLHSLLSQNPNTILRICGLLLRYHREFLPQLRINQPHFYKQCIDRIGFTSNYAQQIIYFLQNGEVVVPRKENGIIKLDLPNETLAAGGEAFSPDSHLCFVSYIMYESRKHSLDLTCQADRRTSLELSGVHLRDIKEFINFFSPSAEAAAIQ